MSFSDHRLGGQQLLGLSNCPHCGVSSPLLVRVWGSDGLTARTDGGQSSVWAAFRCTTCGCIVTARGTEGSNIQNPFVEAIFPEIWEADDAAPESVRKFLNQAHNTLGSPDASVLMSASSIDAMLKQENLTKGSLYERIDLAVQKGLITQKMADWAHRVRLDANNPRHADQSTPHLTADDAKRAFEFAGALVEYLYVLPSRMPPAAP